jgi:O-antigen ligase
MDFFSWYVIYFLVVNTVNTEKRYLIFVAIFLLSSFKISLFGAKTWAMRGFSFTDWGLQGPPGFFENSGELAIQMLMFSPVAYQLAVFIKPYASWTKHKILLLFPITGAMTVMGSSSRGGQVGLVYQFYRTLLKGRLSFKAVAVTVAVAAVAWSIIPDEQKARFSSSGTDQTSLQRLLYWRHGLEMIKEHPVLGVGYFNFSPYFGAHWPEDLLRGAAHSHGLPVSELPHNIFIQVATDTGLLGLGVFLLMAVRTTRIAREIAKLSAGNSTDPRPFASLAKGLVIALWGFLIAGQFVTVSYYPFFWINLALMVALGNITRRHWAMASVRPAASTEKP